MLELTAQVIVVDQERFRQSDGSTRFRDRILERMARELAERMMATPGAVEIEERVNPATGDLCVRARVFVANREADVAGRMTATEVRMRREGKSDMLDAMRYAMPLMTIGPGNIINPVDPSTLTLDSIKKVMEQMEAYNPSPIDFLKGRIERKKGIDEAVESSKARVRADNQIRNSTKTPGEALPVVKVKVRKIQMPND